VSFRELTAMTADRELLLDENGKPIGLHIDQIFVFPDALSEKSRAD
jgi:hypothetical protein